MTSFQDVFNYPFHSLPFASFRADGCRIHSWGDNKGFLWQLSVLRPPYLVILIDSELGAVAGRVHADVTVRVVGHKQVSARPGESAGSGRGRRSRSAPAGPRGAAPGAPAYPRGCAPPGARKYPRNGEKGSLLGKRLRRRAGPLPQGILRGGRVPCDVLIVRKIVIKSDIFHPPTHTQLPAFIELVCERRRKSNREGEGNKKGKEKGERDSLLITAVRSKALRRSVPPSAVRAGRPFHSGRVSRSAHPARGPNGSPRERSLSVTPPAAPVRLRYSCRNRRSIPESSLRCLPAHQESAPPRPGRRRSTRPMPRTPSRPR